MNNIDINRITKYMMLINSTHSPHMILYTNKMINTVMLHNEHIFGTGSIFKFGGIHESYIVVISFVLSGSSVGYFLSKVNPVDGMQLQQSFLEGILVSVLSTTSMAI